MEYNSVVLKVEKLSKSYGKFKAVDNINFEIDKGEIFALIGPNGAGKSTTIKMVATLLSLDTGSISIMNFDLAKHPEKIREQISYLPEEAGAYKNLKGIDYLKLMSELYTSNIAEQKDMIARGKEISKLGDRLNQKISTYSKGMTRKLLLARTVMSKPHLAILDEPTSGLDVINAMEIREVIKRFAKEGMSVLLSSHNMLEIEFLADSVSLIDKGKIIETGSPDELKKKYQSKNLEEVFKKIAK